MNPVFMGIGRVGGIDVRKWRSREEVGAVPVIRGLGFEPTGDPNIDVWQKICETEKSTEFRSGLLWGGIGGLLLGGLVVAFGGRIL